MADQDEVRRLQLLAGEMRKKLLHLCGHYDGNVHIGGDLSMTDLLIALYHHAMRVDPADIRAPGRDRFILSKGHGAVGMYIAMAMRGYFDYDEIVRTYGQLDSAYGMHPCKIGLPGVESSTGSLGHGLPLAVGLALAARHRGETHRVFCLMGDGETCEGSIWEAANVAGSYRLGNLVGIVDRNRQMMTVMDGDRIHLEPYPDKWRAFNWDVVEIDGHDMGAIVAALDELGPADAHRPTVIVADTIKGKGVSFMERNVAWHAGNLSLDDMQRGIAEIDAQLALLAGGPAGGDR